MSYSHRLSASVPLMLSSASYTLSPLNSYGARRSYSKAPSVQTPCTPSTACAACRALMELSELPIVPLITKSFRICTICSRLIVRVSVPKSVLMLLTRQTIPRPGSVSSCSQLPIPISGTSGPTVIVALLSRSPSVSWKLSGSNRAAGVRLCPTSSTMLSPRHR